MSANKSSDCEICEEIHQQGLKSQPPKMTAAGKTVLAVGATIAAVVYGATIPFILPGFRKICLPFVPATEHQIQNILKCLRGRTGSVIDLGSGDGRIILSIMKSDKSGDNHNMKLTKAAGVELNFWLVLYSRLQVWKNRNLVNKNQISFYKKDIMKTDLKIYDNIVVFGVESLMDELEGKLKNELTENGSVIACRFPLPRWQHIHEEGEGIDKVWVYSHESAV